MYEFTEMVRRAKIKPLTGEAPDQTDVRYCIYDKPWGKYVYTQAWVNKCIEDVSSRERFKAAVGKEPKAKVTDITARGGGKAAGSEKPAESA